MVVVGLGPRDATSPSYTYPRAGRGLGGCVHPTSNRRRAGCTSHVRCAGRAPSPASVIWGSLSATGRRSTVPGAKQLVLFS